MLTFDDVKTSTYSEAFAYMQPRGMAGTAFAVTDWVGDAGRCTYDQLREMAAAGWAIGNHTVDHTDLTTLTAEQIDDEILNAKAALDAEGLTGSSMHVAYPSGTYNDTVLAEMAATGMLTGRTTTAGLFDYVAVNHYLLTAVNTAAATTAATVETAITDALALGKIAVVVIHDLNAAPDGYDWTIAQFQALIDWMVTQGISPITINQLYSQKL